MEGNLTKGPILKTLTKLAVPIMASSFLGTLYNITDMAWIGLLGSKAVAGVGVGGMFTWLSQGLAAMARMGGQVHVAQCIGRGDRERAHGFAQAAVQLAAFMGMAYAILSLLFTRQMVGFFQLADAQAHASGNVIYEDCLWADRIFIYDVDPDRTLYCTGRFKDAFYSESCRPGHKYGPGSCADPWGGKFSEAWCCRGCNCNGNSTGDRYEYHDSWNCHTEERKCIKRNQAFCKDPAGISAGDL